jgi:hypothetical protein
MKGLKPFKKFQSFKPFHRCAPFRSFNPSGASPGPFKTT